MWPRDVHEPIYILLYPSTMGKTPRSQGSLWGATRHQHLRHPMPTSPSVMGAHVRTHTFGMVLLLLLDHPSSAQAQRRQLTAGAFYKLESGSCGDNAITVDKLGSEEAALAKCDEAAAALELTDDGGQVSTYSFKPLKTSTRRKMPQSHFVNPPFGLGRSRSLSTLKGGAD